MVGHHCPSPLVVLRALPVHSLAIYGNLKITAILLALF
jgi:hypothetical protein